MRRRAEPSARRQKKWEKRPSSPRVVAPPCSGKAEAPLGGFALEETRTLLEDRPAPTLATANGLAWQLGKRGLEHAIEANEDFTFETTLGGRTITRLLERAVDKGLEVVVRYVGLDSAERHIARVAARVRGGGHHIVDARIREQIPAWAHPIVAAAIEHDRQA